MPFGSVAKCVFTWFTLLIEDIKEISSMNELRLHSVSKLSSATYGVLHIGVKWAGPDHLKPIVNL